MIVRVCLQAAGLVALGVTLLVLWAGPSSVGSNPAPTWVYVWFWVGMVPVSILFGDVYRHVNPLRSIAALVAAIIGATDRSSRVERLRYWPAVVGLGTFLVLETVSQEGDWPRVIAGFVSLYAVVNIAAGVWFGPRWFDRCDGFAVYFSLVGSLSPFGRRGDESVDKSLAAVVLTILGALVLDGLTHFSFWPSVDLVINPSDGDFLQSIVLGAVILLSAILVMTALYAGAMWATERFMKPGSGTAFPVVRARADPDDGRVRDCALSDGCIVRKPGRIPPRGRSRCDQLRVRSRTPPSRGCNSVVVVTGAVLTLFAAQRIGQAVLRPRFVTFGLIPMAALTVIYTTIGVAIVAGS